MKGRYDSGMKKKQSRKSRGGLAFLPLVTLLTGTVALITILFWSYPALARITSQPGYDIIIVAGQSNAAGHGLGPVTNPEPSERDADIYQIGRFGADNMQLIPATDRPLQFWGREDRSWKDFAIPFAREYATRALAPSRKVVIIPAAYGGTSILHWVSASSTEETTIVWEDTVTRIDAALALPGKNRIVVFLWDQGTTDVLLAMQGNETMPDAMTYKARLTEFMGIVRAKIGPKVPILIDELPRPWQKEEPGLSMKNQFNAVIKEVADDGVKMKFVGSQKLTVNAQVVPGNKDDAHYSAQALSILGQRLFDKYCAMTRCDVIATSTDEVIP